MVTSSSSDLRSPSADDRSRGKRHAALGETADGAFARHVVDSLCAFPALRRSLSGGDVRVVEKRPARGPVTLMTVGVSRLIGSGPSIELAVEAIDGQQDAVSVGLELVCDDIVDKGMAPPSGTIWHASEPIIPGTCISAVLLAPSRWGKSFDDVHSNAGVTGHVRTLRLLTDGEAKLAAAEGWDALVYEVGTIDALVDVTRASAVPGCATGLDGTSPVFVTQLHADYLPRWVTFTGSALQSITGLEPTSYIDDVENHEIWSVDTYLSRFPWIAPFVRDSRAGQTAFFTDTTGTYALVEE